MTIDAGRTSRSGIQPYGVALDARRLLPPPARIPAPLAAVTLRHYRVKERCPVPHQSFLSEFLRVRRRARRLPLVSEGPRELAPAIMARAATTSVNSGSLANESKRRAEPALRWRLPGPCDAEVGRRCFRVRLSRLIAVPGETFLIVVRR